MNHQIQKLIKKNPDSTLIEEVFEFAKEAYQDTKRPSGQSNIDHALNVATILSEMNLDQKTVAAGLLHDVAGTTSLSQDKKIELKEIQKKFGPDIATLVEKSS